MDKYISRILNKLVDQYEASKTFTGDNRKNQSFSISLVKEFPKYMDDSDFDTFELINDSIREMESNHYVQVKKQANGVFTSVSLNVSQLENIYHYLKRTPKKAEFEMLNEVFEALLISEKTHTVLKKFAKAQKEKIRQNKHIEFNLGEWGELRDVLKAAQFALDNEKERFVRDASIELFRDSKRLEQIYTKMQTLLFAYGDFENKEHVLEELGIVRTPTYIIMKGNAVITIGEQKIYLNKLCGDIGLSTKTVEEMDAIQVLGEEIVTIENLTTFHNFANSKAFCIYLGGFHNQLKQNVIKKLYKQNPEKLYYHFGDIDAGGFCIYEHLCRKTEVDFKPMCMDIETLKKYRFSWKNLTDNDRKRLKRMKENKKYSVFSNTIDFMLEYNCKLEQEVIQQSRGSIENVY